MNYEGNISSLVVIIISAAAADLTPLSADASAGNADQIRLMFINVIIFSGILAKKCWYFADDIFKCNVGKNVFSFTLIGLFQNSGWPETSTK